MAQPPLTAQQLRFPPAANPYRVLFVHWSHSEVLSQDAQLGMGSADIDERVTLTQVEKGCGPGESHPTKGDGFSLFEPEPHDCQIVDDDLQLHFVETPADITQRFAAARATDISTVEKGKHLDEVRRRLSGWARDLGDAGPAPLGHWMIEIGNAE